MIKLNNHEETYNTARQMYADAVKNEESTPEQVENAWSNMQDALVNSLETQISNRVANTNNDQVVLAGRGSNVLTASENKFFNAVVKTDGFEDDLVLPETVVDRIFEDLTTDHALLAAINFKNLGTITARVITSEVEGTFVWGKIFGEIKGQLDASFKEENFGQSKLTAFVVLSKDLSKFGPSWVEAYVRQQIVESYKLALEQGIVVGAGPTKDQPIGLIRDLKGAIDPTNGHSKKAVTGTLTFADSKTTIKELANVNKLLSVKENGKSVNISGKVALLVNPADVWDIKAQYTIQNSMGAFITALPFNLQIIESQFVTAKEAIAFVADRYDMYATNNVEVNKYTETLALEDCNLFTAKAFAFGKAQDNNVAFIYKLDTSGIPAG